MNPIIKYPGGKRNEIKYFEKYIPNEYIRYVEPFVGGGAVFFHLEPKRALINDLNENLIDFYKSLSSNSNKIIKELKEMKNEEDFFYTIRDMFNSKIEPKYSKASMFFYLNKTAYSGVSRYNKKGEFNTPYGRYKNYNPWKFITKESIDLLKRTEIMNKDFTEIFKLLNENDFVFLDPPYMSDFKQYSVQKDGDNGFSEQKQFELAECFKNSKAKCLMVISDLGIIRNLYKDYIKDEYEKKYSVNAKNQKENKNVVKHLIITNYNL